MSTIRGSAPGDAPAPPRDAAVAAIAWRTQNQLYVTVIAKASFAFTPDAVMTRTEPQEVLRAEVHHGKNPARSVRFTPDLAPYLGRVDVVFTGDACAPGGAEVRSLPVRLSIFGAGGWVLDKRLLVHDKAPFQRMPIVYERAICGPSGMENPLGVDGKKRHENLIDLQDPSRPAGFGPIARAWPARARLLGGTPLRALQGPIAEIPAGFDWSYYQAAPPDQRLDLLRGDEWIVLENLHPEAPRLRMRLPGARGVARIGGLAAAGARGEVVELRADTLRIDGAEQRCTIVWRQIVPVPSEDALAALRIVAGVAVEGEVMSWSDVHLEGHRRAEEAPAAACQGPDGTARIEDARASPRGADVIVERSAGGVEIVDAARGARGSETLSIPPDGDGAATRAPALPFDPATPAPQHGPSEGASPGGAAALGDTTLTLSRDDEVVASSRPVTPFLGQAPLAAAPRAAPEAPIPGAPRSREDAPDSAPAPVSLPLRNAVLPFVEGGLDTSSAPVSLPPRNAALPFVEGPLDISPAPVSHPPRDAALPFVEGPLDTSSAPVSLSSRDAALPFVESPLETSEVSSPRSREVESSRGPGLVHGHRREHDERPGPLVPRVELVLREEFLLCVEPIPAAGPALLGEGVPAAEPTPTPAAEPAPLSEGAPAAEPTPHSEGTPAAELAPLSEGAEVSLERCARIAAELAERPVSRATVLRAHGLSEARWADAERRWKEAMADEARRRERALRDVFDAAYVAAWEAIRGALQPADYARLIVATERDQAAAVLDELAIRRTVWARMQRLWAQRLTRDPGLKARVEIEITKLREVTPPRG